MGGAGPAAFSSGGALAPDTNAEVKWALKFQSKPRIVKGTQGSAAERRNPPALQFKHPII
jgi:hypothetical protein